MTVQLVEILAAEAPFRLRELMQWGIHADLIDGYLYSRGRPPGLGQEIVRCLLNRNAALGTRFLGRLLVTDVVVANDGAGISAYEKSSGTWVALTAKAVIVATGGASALYLRTDNPRTILGDGYRLALEAGAVLQDMEFVQFYPLCLSEPGTTPLVIPPRLADRGRLINDDQEDILEKYEITERPAAEKARDLLSRALYKEIYRKRRNVWLDLRYLSEDDWRIDPFAAALRPCSQIAMVRKAALCAWRRPPIIPWAERKSMPTEPPRCRGSLPRARRSEGCTGPTAWAETR